MSIADRLLERTFNSKVRTEQELRDFFAHAKRFLEIAVRYDDALVVFIGTERFFVGCLETLDELRKMTIKETESYFREGKSIVVRLKFANQ